MQRQSHFVTEKRKIHENSKGSCSNNNEISECLVGSEMCILDRYGEFKDGWEFPGGKIEAGETPQEALKREIMEELDTEIKVGALIDTIEYDYPNFHLSMDCFWCEILSGDLVLKEHENAKWLTKEHIGEVEWPPADVTLIEKIRRYI